MQKGPCSILPLSTHESRLSWLTLLGIAALCSALLWTVHILRQDSGTSANSETPSAYGADVICERSLAVVNSWLTNHNNAADASIPHAYTFSTKVSGIEALFT